MVKAFWKRLVDVDVRDGWRVHSRSRNKRVYAK